MRLHSSLHHLCLNGWLYQKRQLQRLVPLAIRQARASCGKLFGLTLVSLRCESARLTIETQNRMGRCKVMHQEAVIV
jgi:hypothetical protein